MRPIRARNAAKQTDIRVGNRKVLLSSNPSDFGQQTYIDEEYNVTMNNYII